MARISSEGQALIAQNQGASPHELLLMGLSEKDFNTHVAALEKQGMNAAASHKGKLNNVPATTKPAAPVDDGPSLAELKKRLVLAPSMAEVLQPVVSTIPLRGNSEDRVRLVPIKGGVHGVMMRRDHAEKQARMYPNKYRIVG